MLDTLVVQYGNNLTQCLQAVIFLAADLQPSLKEPKLEDISDLVRLFPSNMPTDSFVLQAEFANFVSHVDLTKKKLESLAKKLNFRRIANRPFHCLTKRLYCL